MELFREIATVMLGFMLIGALAILAGAAIIKVFLFALLWLMP